MNSPSLSELFREALGHQQAGRHQEAENLIAQAISLNPKSPDYRNDLGLALKALGRLDEAIEAFRAALALKPGYSEALNNLIEASNERGLVLLARDRPIEAEAAFRQTLALTPNNLAVMNNISLALKAQKRLAEAEKILREALAVAPQIPELLVNLGTVLKERDHIEEAIQIYSKALPLLPQNAELPFDLAECNLVLGRFEPSQDFWRRAVALKSRYSPAALFSLASSMPIIPESSAQIDGRRAHMSRELDRLATERLRISDPLAEKFGTNFYLAYHGKSNLELQKKTATLLLSACPGLGATAAHCAKPKQHKKIRLGLCSAYFSDHTISHLWRGNIENLPRDNIELVLIHASPKRDEMREALDRAADGVVQLPNDLAKAREAVSALELDVLHYTDLGMDRLTWFMAYSRLAPVQSTWWGHPDSTGLPHMDYFITPWDMEPPGGGAHYSERQICFDSLSTYLLRPPFPEKEFSRADFGFPEKGRLYVCPQSPFKFHPDFDVFLAEILKRDENGYLVGAAGTYGNWTKLLKARIARHLPDGERRLIFLDPIPREKYRALLRMADAVIDTPYFGGGFSNFEALAMHVPVILWPLPFMRCRITLAAYRRIGMTECIANSQEDFVELAIRCANDQDWRNKLGQQLAQSVPILFADQDSPKEFARFFFEAGIAARRGEELQGWKTAG